MVDNRRYYRQSLTTASAQSYTIPDRHHTVWCLLSRSLLAVSSPYRPHCTVSLRMYIIPYSLYGQSPYVRHTVLIVRSVSVCTSCRPQCTVSLRNHIIPSSLYGQPPYVHHTVFIVRLFSVSIVYRYHCTVTPYNIRFMLLVVTTSSLGGFNSLNRRFRIRSRVSLFTLESNSRPGTFQCRLHCRVR